MHWLTIVSNLDVGRIKVIASSHFPEEIRRIILDGADTFCV